MNFKLIESTHLGKKLQQKNSRRLFLKKILIGTTGVTIPLFLPINAFSGWGGWVVDLLKPVLKKGTSVGLRAIPFVGVGILAIDIGTGLFELYEEMNPHVALDNDSDETKKGTLGAKLVGRDSKNKGKVVFEDNIELTLSPNSKDTYELTGIKSSEKGEFDLTIIVGDKTKTVHVKVV